MKTFLLPIFFFLNPCSSSHQPLQLVRPNPSHTSFELVTETLSLISSSNASRIAVVSVVGPYHSGKSFLLNALIGRTDVFSVGPKTSPETMGIWIARTNVTLPSHPDVEVWFVDSEGFFGPHVPEDYDAKTFSLAMLLADELVYNTVKVIDSQAVGLLETLARRAQLFRTKTGSVETTTEDQRGKDKVIQEKLEKVPHLTWVVEDFVQQNGGEGVGASQSAWLDSYLSMDGDSSYLKKVFSSLSVESLFLPAVNRQALADLSKVPFEDLTEEFRSDLERLRESIIARLDQTSSPSSTFMTPKSFSQYVYFLGKAVEKGGLFPQLPSLWNSWRAEVEESSFRDAFDLFEKTLEKSIDTSGGAPSSAAVVDSVVAGARSASLHLYTKLVEDFITPVELVEMMGRLEGKLRERHEVTLGKHGESVVRFLSEKKRACFANFSTGIPSLFQESELVEPKRLEEQLSTLAKASVDSFTDFVNAFSLSLSSPVDLPPTWTRSTLPTFEPVHPVDELRGQLDELMSSVLSENAEKISHLVKSAASTAVRASDEFSTTQQSALLSSADLAAFYTQLNETALATFHRQLARDWVTSSPVYADTVSGIETQVRSQIHRFSVSHESRLRQWLAKTSERALVVYRDAKRVIEVTQLPCDEHVLEAEHGKAVAALLRAMDEDLGAGRFSDSLPYREVREGLAETTETELGKLRKKNIELWKVHSDEATQCAAELNLAYTQENCPQGWLCWFRVWPGAHRARSKTHLMDCFDRVKSKASSSAMTAPPSETIQNQVFESWYEKELAREAGEVRNNLWVALASMSVAIGWILYIRWPSTI